MSKSSKGSEFEREVCKRFSEWWTEGERDDVFWRSATSGGRAKARGRAGKSTHGQHGDIAATDPIGQPLIDLFTIELKRGYPYTSVQDLMDSSTKTKLEWEAWYLQVAESKDMAGSASWMMITKKDRRRALVLLPSGLLSFLLKKVVVPFLQFRAQIKERKETIQVSSIRLDDFLTYIKPDDIVQALEHWQRKKLC